MQEQRRNVSVFKEDDIVKRIKVNRLRWAGPEEAPIVKVFKSDFIEGERSCGLPKNSWNEAVDRDSTALGIRNWQRAANDRVSYRAILWMSGIFEKELLKSSITNV